MIRNNKNLKPQPTHLKLHTYNYRNALYQGELHPKTSTRHGRGLIYITDSHHLIATRQFN
jgi:hypothetical protein